MPSFLTILFHHLPSFKRFRMLHFILAYLFHRLFYCVKIFQISQTLQVWVLEETMQLLLKGWVPLLGWLTYWSWTWKDVLEFMAVLVILKVCLPLKVCIVKPSNSLSCPRQRYWFSFLWEGQLFEFSFFIYRSSAYVWSKKYNWKRKMISSKLSLSL